MPSKIIYVCCFPPLYHICSWSPRVFFFLFVLILISQKRREGEGRRRDKEAGTRETTPLFPSPVFTSKFKHLQGHLSSVRWSQGHSAPKDSTSKGAPVFSIPWLSISNGHPHSPNLPPQITSGPSPASTHEQYEIPFFHILCS